ncbi:MAG: Rrf2 family transcriptional regulator [Alphaproteobacteria bacterium]|jgi:Rrf2 family protein|nr:Rrf2 family transcriptional regulator [Alphaproteobacteria bacterium]
MLKLPRKTMFAVEAVVDIAYHARPEPVQSKEITRRQGIPQRYLEQVMQQLVHAGVLKGVRGPRGGYTLARERRRISLGEVVRAIDAGEEGDGPDEEETGSEIGLLVVRPLVAELREEMMRRLDAISLEELCQRSAERGIVPDRGARADFTI